ncbi:MAG: hypothetical protein HGB11_07415 [Chlorobiales bacterium]|jgi:hypothetical protein|nr:hypothetical protein [Chlorobiales bacterium]
MIKATIHSAVARMKTSFIFCIAFIGVVTAHSQTRPALQATYNPCQDSLYLLLKDAPPVSLTESERRYIEQKEKECREHLTGKKQEQKPLPIKSVQEKQVVPQAELGTAQREGQEDFLTVRNVGIVAAIVGAVVGLAIALGSVAKAPF